jgi:hypothetical protein
MHGTRLVYGYRVDKLAYLTDCSHIPPSSMALLQDLDTLILDALRPREHPTHLSTEQAFALGRNWHQSACFLPICAMTRPMPSWRSSVKLQPCPLLQHLATTVWSSKS